MNAQVFSFKATAVAAALTAAAPRPRPAESACGVSVEVASITTSLKALTFAPASMWASTVLSRISARTAASIAARATLPATEAPSSVSCPIAFRNTFPAGALTCPATPTFDSSWRNVPAIDAPTPIDWPSAPPPARVVVVTLLVAFKETLPVVAVRLRAGWRGSPGRYSGAVGEPALSATAHAALVSIPLRQRPLP